MNLNLEKYFATSMSLDDNEIKPFSDELRSMKNLFKSWNPCQQVIVMCSFMDELSFENREFLRNKLGNLPKNPQELNAEQDANNCEHVLGIVHKYVSVFGDDNIIEKTNYLLQAIKLLPLMKVNNVETSRIYMTLMINSVLDAEKLSVPIELVQQLLGYMLVHAGFDDTQKQQIKVCAKDFDSKHFARKTQVMFEANKQKNLSNECLVKFFSTHMPQINESVDWLFRPSNADNPVARMNIQKPEVQYMKQSEEQLKVTLASVLENDSEPFEIAPIANRDNGNMVDQRDLSSLSTNIFRTRLRSHNLNIDAPVFTLPRAERSGKSASKIKERPKPAPCAPMKKSISDTYVKNKEKGSKNKNPGMSRIGTWLNDIRHQKSRHIFQTMDYYTLICCNQRDLVQRGANFNTAKNLFKHIRALHYRSNRLTNMSKLISQGQTDFDKAISDLTQIIKTPMLPMQLVQAGEENIAQQFWEVLQDICQEICDKAPTLKLGYFLRWKLMWILDQALKSEEFEIVAPEIVKIKETLETTIMQAKR